MIKNRLARVQYAFTLEKKGTFGLNGLSATSKFTLWFKRSYLTRYIKGSCSEPLTFFVRFSVLNIAFQGCYKVRWTEYLTLLSENATDGQIKAVLKVSHGFRSGFWQKTFLP